MAEASDAPELKDLVIVLKAVDWHELGLQLGLECSKLDEIDDQYAKIPRKRSTMLGSWLDNEEEPTWGKIVTALERLGSHNGVIKTIKSEFMKTPLSPDSSSSKDTRSNSTTKNFTLVEICTALTDIIDWHSLGKQLGIKKSKLDVIRLDYDKYGQNHQKTEMIDCWLRSDTSASWEKLCAALEAMDCNAEAKNIREKYCS